MPESLQKEIQLRANSGATGPGQMHVMRYNERERNMRAAKALALYWLIAAVCILIPVAHFILVPGFLIAGLVVAKRKKGMSEEGLHVQCRCPACAKEVRIELEHSAELPQWRKCPACGEGLELVACPDHP